MELASAGRSMRADLIIEAHNLVPVVRPEEDEVANVRLPHEPLDGAGEHRLRSVRRERIVAANVGDRAIANRRAALRALDANAIAVDGADQADAWMREQLGVELRV